MSKFKTFTITWLSLLLVIILGSSALAVMPPAPYEWYSQRLKIPVPEGVKRGAPTIPDAIERDLALAAQLRPSNTDNLLIILVQFSDNLADVVNHPPQAYTDLLFSTGVVPTGSLVEYYQEISYGAFTPQGTVVAWITAPHTYDYYAYGDYGMGSHPNNSQGLLEDCVNQPKALSWFMPARGPKRLLIQTTSGRTPGGWRSKLMTVFSPAGIPSNPRNFLMAV
jgi:hypothetical protein